MRHRDWTIGFGLLLIGPSALSAQTPTRIELSSPTRAVAVGDRVQLTATVFDSAGNEVDALRRFYSSARRDFPISRDGLLQPIKGGEYVAYVRVNTARNVRDSIVFVVDFPPVREVSIEPAGARFFVGATVRHEATVIDAMNTVRTDLPVRWSTDDPAVASVNRFGDLTAHRDGRVTLWATAEGVTGAHEYQVVASPIRTLTLSISQDSARTGDVLHATAVALDANGQRVEDAPVTFAVISHPADSIVAASPPAEIDQRGRFVAEKAGNYTILAIAPGRVERQTVQITNRHVVQEVSFVGQAGVRHVPTSDLWIWEGVDGRDYGVTGTWGAYGAAYFWDVTDAASPELIDSIIVDARTVNDVKVSEDGRVAVISREGASNRRNGIVVLDVTNPRDVQIHSTFDDELTGGVHNLFIYKNHVYAVNNGRRFDVIKIEDPKNPHRVGRFELDTPGHGIHDIWIVDGIAYTSNWADGVVLIDVGNGIAGGSPSNPVQIASYADFGGATHAAFPYRSPTGKFYVFMGDERGRPGFDLPAADDAPPLMSGYVHVVDFTDPLNPEEVARYEVPEAGSHNLWIEDDKLYAAYYNGGVRVVDVSGELMGNLSLQNREIARYMAYDPEGYVPNAPFTWGPQPYKGNLFIAEHHSGLWAIKLQPRRVLTQ
ncbi:MAG: Ig-like domain-containing protein [Gemmatimonadetes bacterium]|nr:Ig-like domain-containing protein [Gemmatimonadota bacterium]